MKKHTPDRHERGQYEGDGLVMAVTFIILFTVFCLSLFALAFY